jgi:hypothetical protein
MGASDYGQFNFNRSGGDPSLAFSEVLSSGSDIISAHLLGAC